MKKKYTTLNEEINRMKSLFGESRLYGNIVDSQVGKNVISEQFKFFDNVADAFRLGTKQLDNVKLTKFLNREINSIDDIVNHIGDFATMWAEIVPTKKWGVVKSNLEWVMDNLGRIPNMTEEKYLKYFNMVVNSTPEEGGMRTIVTQLITTKRYGGKNLLGSGISKEVAITKTGEVVVGTKSIGGTTIYKNVKDEVIPLNKIDLDVNSKVTTLKDEKGELIGYIDENGKWVNKKGEPLTGEMKSKVVQPNVVPRKKVPEGSNMDDLNNKVFEDTKENVDNIKAAQEDEISNGGVADVQSETLEWDITDVDKEKIQELTDKITELETRLVKQQNEFDKVTIESLEGTIKELKDDLRNLRSSKETPKVDNSVEANITDKQRDFNQKQLVEQLGWNNRFANWFSTYFFPLKLTGEEGAFVRKIKQGGSATVDPLGVVPWYKEYVSIKMAGVQKIERNQVTRRKIYRTVVGASFNVMFWNLTLYHLGHRVLNWEGGKSYSMTNIFPKYWENLKYNYLVQVAVWGGEGWLKGEMTSFCEELEKKTKKSCEWWESGWKDYIKETLEDKYGNMSCEEFNGLFDGNGKLKTEKRKELVGEISEKWNDKLSEETGIGWVEEVVETLLGWKTKITEVGDKLFDKHTIKIPDGKGGEEEVNAIDFYVRTASIKACINQLKTIDDDVNREDVKVTETVNA